MNWQQLVIGKFSWWRLIRLPVIIYVVLLVMGGCFSYLLIFPYRGCSYDESLRGLRFLPQEDGERLAMTFHQAPNEKYLALYLHGNASDLGTIYPITYEQLRHGVSVLAIDYPDYGLSGGKPTEASTIDAAEMAYQEALKMGYRPEQILIWGRSIGSGVAMGLAERVPARAVVLDCPFASAFTVRTHVRLLPFDRFDSEARARTLDKPLFIIHAEHDEIIHPNHSKKLIAAHQGQHERHVIPDATHNTVWEQNLEEVWESLFAFLEQ